MRKLFFLGLLFIISNIALAQSGKISGRVINAGSGQGLANATIVLIEESKTETADPNGSFSFNNLKAGTYSIKCSYTGHVDKIIDEIILKTDDNTVVNISLEEKKSDEVVVTATRAKAAGESVATLLIFQKNLANVSDGITVESIRKTPDRSTGDVIKRVSGASIQDDRFAVIRGLNDRYNASFINGAPLPSTESDRKAFAFDIFPAVILDNLVIYKTATPDKIGDFAGGIIDITTKSIPAKNFTSISFSIGVNSLLTGKTRYFSENKGGKDWIGIDDGTRAIPGGIPSIKELKNSSFEEKGEYAKLFGNYKWGIKQGRTSPDFNFQVTKGFSIERKQKEFLGTLFSLNYKRGYTFNEGDRNSFDFDLTAPADQQLIQKGKYKDSVYNDEVVVALLGNVSVKINNKNNISWKNNLSINTDNKFVKRIGAPNFQDEPNTFIKEAVRWFTSNKIFSSQLAGEHLVGNKKTKINWLGAYSKVNREIPNLSRTSYAGTFPNVTSDLYASFSFGPPSQTVGMGSMFFTNSNENIKSIKADITQPYTFMKNSQNFVKIGGGYQARERYFTSRVLGFSPYNGGGVSYDNSLSQLPEGEIFLPEHLGKLKTGEGGFLLNDGTLSYSDYDASSALIHAYLMNDQRFFKKFRLIYGARLERFNQKLNSVKNLNELVQINTVVTDLLPSVNFVYALTSTMNLRISYAKTVNRPEFRELAPFIFYDFVSNYTYEGQEILQRAKIKNFDFRYEFFPGKAQLFSISAFYKEFKNPIEIVTVPNTSSQTIYINAESAKVYGIEAEFRTLLSTLAGINREGAFLSKFTLSANMAYIKSKVKLGPLFSFDPSQLVTDRPLQGQSPYLINSSLSFNDERTGFSSTLSVNRVGDRLAIGGTFKDADIYEKARTVVDFQLAKYFLSNKLEVKFTARDILAQNLSFYFDYDRSKSNTDRDRYFSNYNTPKVFNFSAAYKF